MITNLCRQLSSNWVLLTMILILSQRIESKETSSKCSCSRMVPSTKENGILVMTPETAKACKSGQMDLSMKAIGEVIKRTGEEDLSMQTEMCMKESGKMIRRTEEETTTTQTARGIRVIGSRISNMDRELRLGQMEQGMKERIKMERKMVLGNLHGQMDQPIKEISLTITYTVKEFTLGLIKESTQESG